MHLPSCASVQVASCDGRRILWRLLTQVNDWPSIKHRHTIAADPNVFMARL